MVQWVASAQHSTPCSIIPQETRTLGIKALRYRVALQSVLTVITFVLT